MAEATRQPDSVSAIILAAGKGTRMKSDLPKVLHEVGGRPMLCAVVDACRGAGCGRVVLVVGYRQERVREAMGKQGAAWNRGIEYALQGEQLGTGHAVRCAEPMFGAAEATDAVFVLAGDGPLIRAETLRTLLERHRGARAEATLATSVIDDPTGYGRIVRDAGGKFVGIVEHKQCTPDQLKIREVNPSYYCFNTRSLFATLRDVLDVSDSVLSKHLSALAADGYLTSTKGVHQGRRTTWVSLTPDGRRALSTHVAELRRIIDGVE